MCLWCLFLFTCIVSVNDSSCLKLFSFHIMLDLIHWIYDVFYFMLYSSSQHLPNLTWQVAVIAPNVPALFEAHFGVPMAGAVLNSVNIRLNAQAIAFLLGHSKSEIVMVDQEFFTLVEEALKIQEGNEKNFKPPLLVVIGDKSCDPKSLKYALGRGAIEYEKFLESGDPEFDWKPPEDEWQSIALGYTSGTTSSPKGVVLSHRGAYLMSLSNPIIWGMDERAIYLWTLPMFHCNGWCFTWTLAAVCVTSICLRQVILHTW